MKVSQPLVWGAIGAGIGFFAAIGGRDTRIADGLVGAIVQFIIWFSVAWIVIRKKNLNRAKKAENESAHNNIEVKSSGVKLEIVFLSTYFILLIGVLVDLWNDTGNPYLQWSFIDRISNLSSYVFSLAGIFDVFIFPSLAFAITITSAFFFYRKSEKKLKNKKNKLILIFIVSIATFITWSLLSLLLVLVLK